MSAEPRQEAAAELASAFDLLEEAVALERAGFERPCVHSAYYAMFFAARAALLMEGVKSRTHQGVHSEFVRLFVHPGRVPSDYGGYLSRASNARIRVDYEGGAVVDEEEAEWVLEVAETFVQGVASLLDVAQG